MWARSSVSTTIANRSSWNAARSGNLGGQYVELYAFADRPLEVRWKGLLLPYRIFSKDQRVSHTAIVENKRLGHALALVKAQQELKHATKVMTNSEKTGYWKRTRMVMRRRSCSAMP